MADNILRITVEVLTADGETLRTEQLEDCSFSNPTKAAEVGLSHEQQLEIMAAIQQSVLDTQAYFLNRRPSDCPECHAAVQKNGLKSSVFKHVFSDHHVKLQKWICSNPSCDWQMTPSFYSQFSVNLSPELMKIQAELGAQNTYGKSANMLALVTGKRSVNNKSRIHRTTNIVGKHIEEVVSKKAANDWVSPKPAKEIILNVDGLYIHDDEHRGHNFEAMVAKVFQPDNLIKIGSSQRPVIIQKHCAGSAKKDDQETMKQRVLEACKLEGLTKETTVTALSDGARNCWNIIKSILASCLMMICILDWFHIGKYVTTVKGQLPKEYGATLDLAKQALWYGRTSDALSILDDLKAKLTVKKQIKKVVNFSQYIKDNEPYIVNYDERQEAGLVFSSSIAESTVEHYASSRFKKRQKMQWKRDNVHGVLQIRATIISGGWDMLWKEAGNEIFRKKAA